MKRLNITKEQFEKSRYFKNKYGTLEYVSESGNLYKTNKGKVLMFKESMDEPKYSIGDTVYIYNQEWIVEKVKFSERIGEFVYDLYTDDGGHTIGIPENHLSDTPSKPPRRPRNRKFNESAKKFDRKFVKESYHGNVKVEASIVATGRTAEEALELLHNRLHDADAKIIDENENPNPEIVDKYNYWFDENMGDVDFDICRDNNSNGFIQMGIKAI